MAIDLETKYPGRTTGASADYPYGAYKNESTPGANDGTPLEVSWANDQEGYKQKILVEANVEPNNEVDTVQKCQGFSALQLITANGTKIPEATLENLCAGMNGMAWHDPAAAPNHTDASLPIIDSCLAWGFGTERPRLLIITSNVVKPVGGPWDYHSSPSIGSEISFIFPYTAEYILSVCSDYNYIYVAWIRDSDNYLMISKYAANTFTGNAIWTVSPGISYSDSADIYYIKLINANSEYLAISLPYFDIGGNNAHGVGIIRKSNGTVTLGHGNNTDYTTTDAQAQYGKIVSDSSHVFWLGKETSDPDNIYLVSAKITSPTMSNYSLQTVMPNLDPDTERQEYFHGLLNIGGSTSGVVIALSADGLISVFSKQDDDIKGTARIAEFTPQSDSSGYDVMIGSDGINAWFYLFEDDPNSSNASNVLYKLPLSTFNRMGRRTTPDGYRYVYPAPQRIYFTDVDDDFKAGNMIFDGRDMWAVTRAGEIFRIVNPGLR